MQKYIVASIGEWNKELFDNASKANVGEWHYVSTPRDLSELIKKVSPNYIFFPHWRWKVPQAIVSKYECICFHMTDVPFGRGGTPLQNLIVRGHKNSVLTALRMEESMDTGPVYYKKPFNLSGTAHEIYKRTAKITWEMIFWIIENKPKPKKQLGKPVLFKRRSASESKIPSGLNLEQVYDRIRMVDAPGYPNAFIEKEGLHIEFNQAKLIDDELTAIVKIKIKG